jgi:uncharacterized protein YraI
MKALRVLAVAAALLAGAPAIVNAQNAYTTKNVHLRAGPSVEYPVVAILPAGLPISVIGCMDDYRWCDVLALPNRGWVYAGNIVYAYQGENVPVLTSGAAIGLAIIGFSIGTYWDTYYRDRPWYPQRRVWIERSRSRFGPGNRRPPQAPVARPGAHPASPPRQATGRGPRPAQGRVPERREQAPRPQAPREGKYPSQDRGPGGR